MTPAQQSASADKKRRRDRERYSLMNHDRKGAYLQNKRDYMECKRRANTLSTRPDATSSGDANTLPNVRLMQECTQGCNTTGIYCLFFFLHLVMFTTIMCQPLDYNFHNLHLPT